MNEERDKFLTKAIGGCWHEWQQRFSGGGSRCIHCESYWPLFPNEETQRMIQRGHTPDFSTWEGYGKLWEWAQEQEWWMPSFKKEWWGMLDTHLEFLPDSIIHPDRFADALYTFLKERSTP